MGVDPLVLHAFHCAVETGRVNQAKQLHSQGINLNITNYQGQPVIDAALTKIRNTQARSSMVCWLLHAGADTGYIDPYTGRNLLTTAVCFNCTEEVHMLLKYGQFDLSTKDRKGRTALHYATIHNNVQSVYYIVSCAQEHEVSLDIPDNAGWTPFIIASILGYHQIRALIVKYTQHLAEQFIPASMNTATLKASYTDFKWYPSNRVVLVPIKTFPPGSSLRQTPREEPRSAPQRFSSCAPISHDKPMTESDSRLVSTEYPRQTRKFAKSPRFNSDTSSNKPVQRFKTSTAYVRHFLQLHAKQSSDSYRPHVVPRPPQPKSLRFPMAARMTSITSAMSRRNSRKISTSVTSQLKA